MRLQMYAIVSTYALLTLIFVLPVRSTTYDYLTYQLTLTFTGAQLGSPTSMIKCIEGGANYRVLALDTKNRYSIVEATNYPTPAVSVLNVITSGPTYKFHSSPSTKSPKQAFQVDATNYFIIGTSATGMGLVRLDIGANTFTEQFGLVDFFQTISQVTKLGSTYFVSGPSFEKRLVLTGRVVFSVTTLGSFGTVGSSGDLFAAMDNTNIVFYASGSKSVGKISVTTQATVDTTYSRFWLKDLIALTYIPSTGYTVGCDSNYCFMDNGNYDTPSFSFLSKGINSINIPQVLSVGGGPYMAIIGLGPSRLAATLQWKWTLLGGWNYDNDFSYSTGADITSLDSYLADPLVVYSTTNGVGMLSKSSGQCDPSCLTCYGTNNAAACTSCRPGKTLAGASPNSCIPCYSTCSTCATSAFDQCLSCPSGLVLNQPAPAQCTTCDLSCQTCLDGSPTGCISCHYGFGLSSTPGPTSCGACDQNCLSCSTISVSGCISCKPGFALNGMAPAACTACYSTCATCSGLADNQCVTCNSGFYLSASNECLPCTGNCATCTSISDSSCLTCDPGYVLRTSPGPAYCDAITCSTNCLTCIDTTITGCTSCNSGFYPGAFSASFPCNSCHSDCLTCDGAGDSSCTLCYAGKAVVELTAGSGSGTCQACYSSCETCETIQSSKCLTCKDGFGFTSVSTPSGTCTTCHVSCDTCISTVASDCKTCSVGYAPTDLLVPTTCGTCSSNCSACADLSDSGCTACQPGFALNGMTPNECLMCTGHCATCLSLLSTSCLTCDPGYTLSGLSPNTCVPCSGNCATCLDTTTTSCTSCKAGYSQSTISSSCDPIPCDTTCSICIGQQPDECIQCDTSYRSLNTSTGTCDLLPSVHPTCLANGQGHNSINNTCVRCFEPEDFYSNQASCTKSEHIRYLDWKIVLEADPDTGQPRLRLEVVNPEAIFLGANSIQHFGVSFASQWNVQTNDSSISIQKTTSNTILFQGCSMEDLKSKALMFSIGNNLPAVVYADSDKYLLLVHRFYSILSTSVVPLTVAPPTRPSPIDTTPITASDKEPVDPTTTKIGTAIGNYSRSAALASGGAALLGSSCVANMGPAFIKLFQVIELLGKLYFTPVGYSNLMDFFLTIIYNLSDLIALPRDVIIPEQSHHPNTSFGKLSWNMIERHLLRSMPLFVPLYLGLVFLVFCLKTISGLTTSTIVVRAVKIATAVRWFVFEINFVDFGFAASFALTGPYDYSLMLDWTYLVNKLLGIWLMYELTKYLIKIWMMVEGVKADPTEFDYDHEAISEVVMEGIKSSKVRGAKLYNLFFRIKLLAYQVILVSAQNFPILSITLLVLITVLFLVQFMIVTFKYKPWNGWSSTLQIASIEVCIIVFLFGISLRLIRLYHRYVDYAVILLTFICILMQIIHFVKSLIDSVIGMIKKHRNKSLKLALCKVSQKNGLTPLATALTTSKREVIKNGNGSLKCLIAAKLEDGNTKRISVSKHLNIKLKAFSKLSNGSSERVSLIRHPPAEGVALTANNSKLELETPTMRSRISSFGAKLPNPSTTKDLRKLDDPVESKKNIHRVRHSVFAPASDLLRPGDAIHNENIALLSPVTTTGSVNGHKTSKSTLGLPVVGKKPSAKARHSIFAIALQKTGGIQHSESKNSYSTFLNNLESLRPPKIRQPIDQLRTATTTNELSANTKRTQMLKIGKKSSSAQASPVATSRFETADNQGQYTPEPPRQAALNRPTEPEILSDKLTLPPQTPKEQLRPSISQMQVEQKAGNPTRHSVFGPMKALLTSKEKTKENNFTSQSKIATHRHSMAQF